MTKWQQGADHDIITLAKNAKRIAEKEDQR